MQRSAQSGTSPLAAQAAGRRATAAPSSAGRRFPKRAGWILVGLLLLLSAAGAFGTRYRRFEVDLNPQQPVYEQTLRRFCMADSWRVLTDGGPGYAVQVKVPGMEKMEFTSQLDRVQPQRGTMLWPGARIHIDIVNGGNASTVMLLMNCR